MTSAEQRLREMAILSRKLVRCTDQEECDKMEARLQELEALDAIRPTP